MPRLTSRHLLAAIFFVAAYATSHWAVGQNAPQNTASPALSTAPDPRATDKLERERIGQERAAARARLEAAKAHCYQLFLVNPCLLQARDAHLAQLAQLKRQDNVLNDLQRKRRAALQMQQTEERSTPQSPLAQAQQRDGAQDRAAQRAQRASDRTAARAAASLQKQPKAQPQGLAAPSARQAPARNQTLRGTAARQPKPPPQATSAAPRQAKQAKKAQNPAAFEQRIQDAQTHRENVQKRLQSRTKPPAAPLPVPAQ